MIKKNPHSLKSSLPLEEQGEVLKSENSKKK